MTEKRQRILYIHHGGAIGGAPLSLLYLLQKLDRDRYEPLVVTLKPGPVVDLYRSEGIETHVEPRIADFSHTELEWYGGADLWRLPLQAARVPLSIAFTRRLIRRFQPDLVHLNSSALGPSAIASLRESVPVVWHIREPLVRGYTGLRRSWLRRIARRVDAVVAISHFDADQIGQAQSAIVVYNFVDFDHFNRNIDGRSVRDEFGIPTGSPVIAMLGGVARPKGTVVMLRAMPYLIGRLPSVRLLIAGPEPRTHQEGGLKGLLKRALRVDAYQEEVREIVESLPAEAREAVTFSGVRRDIPAIIAASAAVIFPSVVPHFARPLIEAAAMGKPGVGSDLGGPQELIEHGVTGYLVPPHNPSRLADAIASLLEDPQTAGAMGEAAYQRARLLFDAERNAQKTFTIYEAILNKVRPL